MPCFTIKAGLWFELIKVRTPTKQKTCTFYTRNSLQVDSLRITFCILHIMKIPRNDQNKIHIYHLSLVLRPMPDIRQKSDAKFDSWSDTWYLTKIPARYRISGQLLAGYRISGQMSYLPYIWTNIRPDTRYPTGTEKVGYPVRPYLGSYI